MKIPFYVTEKTLYIHYQDQFVDVLQRNHYRLSEKSHKYDIWVKFGDLLMLQQLTQIVPLGSSATLGTEYCLAVYCTIFTV